MDDGQEVDFETGEKLSAQQLVRTDRCWVACVVSVWMRAQQKT